MHYLAKNHSIYLKRDELESFFKKEFEGLLISELKKRKLTLQQIGRDKSLMMEISTMISKSLNKDNDSMEIFYAWNSLLDFYLNGLGVGFELKSGFNPAKYLITTLKDLKKAINKDTINDFFIWSSDGIRSFQLKRYSGEMTEKELYAFITEQIGKYGTLGETNLLIILQPKIIIDINSLKLKNIYKKIIEHNYSFSGEILINYNEKNQLSVINRIYPKLGTARIPINWKEPENVPKVEM